MIVWAVILGVNLFNKPAQPGRITQLQEKNTIQQKEIGFFSEKIVEVQNQIAQMKEFDSKLRVIANLDSVPSPFFGVGGPLPDDLRERMGRQYGPEASASPGQPDSIPSILQARPPEKDLRQREGHAPGSTVHLSHVPSIWPSPGWIIGDFGFRVSPLTGQLQMHEGIEISNSLGTPVVAPTDGLVAAVGTDPDHGKMVVLSHGHGIVTRYGHLGEVDVEVGQKVRMGQAIGKMGNSGFSIGPHLYYEVRVNGVPTDPRNYFHN